MISRLEDGLFRSTVNTVQSKIMNSSFTIACGPRPQSSTFVNFSGRRARSRFALMLKGKAMICHPYSQSRPRDCPSTFSQYLCGHTRVAMFSERKKMSTFVTRRQGIRSGSSEKGDTFRYHSEGKVTPRPQTPPAEETS